MLAKGIADSCCFVPLGGKVVSLNVAPIVFAHPSFIVYPSHSKYPPDFKYIIGIFSPSRLASS